MSKWIFVTSYTAIQSNTQKTSLFMAGFVAFVILIMYVTGELSGYGTSFIWIGVFISLASCIGSYYFGDQIVIAMSGARKADRKKEFDFLPFLKILRSPQEFQNQPSMS